MYQQAPVLPLAQVTLDFKIISHGSETKHSTANVPSSVFRSMTYRNGASFYGYVSLSPRQWYIVQVLEGASDLQYLLLFCFHYYQFLFMRSKFQQVFVCYNHDCALYIP
jgi:hypothetical protein